ncbi:hypothetical protein D9O50_07275 [Oxalobacteraceae bacterium CAVE-383]|nr:hypothetical protein D9O50_07275 [Oxalobacteraceae bacterium CAVE-383]
MVSAVGTDFGGKFRQLFESKMTQIMNSCGVNVQIAYRGEVRLNDDYEERAKTFQADTIMVINRSRGTIQSMEQIKSTYDVRLQEAASNKLVWRANVDFDIRNQSGGLEERAGSLVTALFNKMKSDGLLTNCSAD